MKPVIQPQTVVVLKEAVAKGYHVNNDGNVQGPRGSIKGWSKGSKRARESMTGEFNLGREAIYQTFGLKRPGKTTRHIAVHQLQAYQKFGDAIAGFQVRHLNGNTLDNSASNIAIGTGSQNSNDRPASARQLHAQHAADVRKRWSDADVRRLRAARVAGALVVELAAEEGVSKGMMSMMLARVTYKNVSDPP